MGSFRSACPVRWRPRRAVFAAALPAVLALLSPRPAAGAVDILYTAHTDGRLENCRCPNDPLGGLEKRLPEVERRRALGPLLLIDGGDFSPNTLDSLGTAAMIEAMALFPYDAVALGVQELLQGRDLVRAAAKRLPLVTTNLSFTGGGQIGARVRLVERGGERYAVAAVIQPALIAESLPNQPGWLAISDPDSALRSALAEVPPGVKVIIIAHAERRWLREHVGGWSRADLVVSAHQGERIDGIEHLSGTPVVAPGRFGRYFGVARIHGGRARAELVPVRQQMPDSPEILDLVLRLRAKRKRLRAP